MRFAWIMAAIVAAMTSQLNAAQDYSKAYTQCTNMSYGQQSTLEKCVKKELKLQSKVLKKSYKNYVKLNPNNAAIIQNQYVMFEKKVKNQCSRVMAGQQTQIKRGECQLEMVIAQTNWYQARSFSASR